MWDAGLGEAQAAINISRRNINNLKDADDKTIFMAESGEPLDERERGEWKSWLKNHGNWSHRFMANRWGNNGNNEETIFWAPKSLQMVTAAMKLKDTYSLEEKLWPT